MRSDPKRINNDGTDMDMQRERMRDLRERILRPTGGKIWNSIDETADDHRMFAVSHERNRRHLHLQYHVSFKNEGRSTYAIGQPSGLQTRGKGSSQAQVRESGNGRNNRHQPAPSRPRAVAKSSKSTKKDSKSRGKGNASPARPPKQSTNGRPSCTVKLNVDFLQLSAIPPALFLNPNIPDDQLLGTRYIYNDGLRDQDTLDELIGSKVSGSCTRTQARVGNEEVGLQLGQGQCHFTYVLTDSKNRKAVFTASGDVVDSIGGILSITGGSQATLGAFGEIELLPVNIVEKGKFETENGDFFLDPLFYAADARIFVPCDYL